MSNDEFVSFLRDVRRETLFEYIDWEKYLSSGDEKYSYIGTPAVFRMGEEKSSCIIVGKTNVFGKPYLRIIRDGEIVAVPANFVYVQGCQKGR
jgi:hypothetical protein